MFSIADLLDRAKRSSNIVSDYQLSKILRINQSKLSNYRSGRALPNVEMLESLCALSGDDVAVIVAQVEATRCADGPARATWLMIANRLQSAAKSAVLTLFFAISFIAAQADSAMAATVSTLKPVAVNSLYIV